MPINKDHIEHLIIEELTGNISDSDHVSLNHLIRENEDARELWNEIKETHEIFSGGNFMRTLNEKEAWEKVNAQLVVPNTVLITNTKKQYFFTAKKSLAFAAILALIVTSLSIFLYKKEPQTIAKQYDGVVLKMSNGKIIEIPNGQQNITVDQNTNSSLKLADGSVLADAQKDGLKKEEFNTLYVPAGKDYHLVLADGTEVWLNATTEFKFPISFIGDTRTVSIKGEGFFKVAQGNTKPFIVSTPGMDVRVLGTEFNVKCYDDEPSKTSLVAGKVSLKSHSGKETLLRPGKEAELAGDGNLIINDFEQDTTLAWIRGIYIFNNQELAHLQSVIKRWYDMELVIEEGALAKKRFTGTVQRNKPIVDFLNSVTKSSDIQYQIKNRQIVFYSPK